MRAIRCLIEFAVWLHLVIEKNIMLSINDFKWLINDKIPQKLNNLTRLIDWGDKKIYKVRSRILIRHVHVVIYFLCYFFFRELGIENILHIFFHVWHKNEVVNRSWMYGKYVHITMSFMGDYEVLNVFINLTGFKKF